jgi:hypothetical protein
VAMVEAGKTYFHKQTTKLLITLALSTLVMDTFAQKDLDITLIRETFFGLTHNSDQAPEFHAYLLSLDQDHPIVVGYRGATEALLTKHTWSPIEKFRFLQRAEKSLNMAVTMSPDNVEVRFIRYAVETHIPRFLGFSDHLEEDESFLALQLNHMSHLELDMEMKTYILDFLREKSKLTESQLNELQAEF